MTGILWGALAVLGTLAMTAFGDMVSEEVRDRLDHVPHAILRYAARRLDPDQRITVYEEVWLPDLAYFLKGDEARPVTRLIHGTRFALGILMTALRMSTPSFSGYGRGLVSSFRVTASVAKGMGISDQNKVLLILDVALAAYIIPGTLMGAELVHMPGNKHGIYLPHHGPLLAIHKYPIRWIIVVFLDVLLIRIGCSLRETVRAHRDTARELRDVWTGKDGETCNCKSGRPRSR